MTNWRDNLKFCLMQAGVEAKITTFLFVDTQIINEKMLEDNYVPNSGDIPQLYKTDDLEGIFNVGKQLCQKKGLPVNKMNMFGQYLLRVKSNIHCTILKSPLDYFQTETLEIPFPCQLLYKRYVHHLTKGSPPQFRNWFTCLRHHHRSRRRQQQLNSNFQDYP